jgi:hypothetical protein
MRNMTWLIKDAQQMGIVQQKIYTHSETVDTYNINTETIAHKQYYALYNIPSCVSLSVYSWTFSYFEDLLKTTFDE